MVGLDRSTYYDIKFRKPNDREIRRLMLADAIADIHARSRGTYGILRIRAALEIEQGLIVNTKLVETDHARARHSGACQDRRQGLEEPEERPDV